MGRTIRVTNAEVIAAKALVAEAQRTGAAVSDTLRAIAEVGSGRRVARAEVDAFYSPIGIDVAVPRKPAHTSQRGVVTVGELPGRDRGDP